MKLLISILLSCFCFFYVNAQNFYNGVPTVLPTIAHPTNVSSAPFIVGGVRSDTMVVTGSSLGSSYFSCSGADSLHPFVVYYNNTNGAGIGIENCHYFKAIGIGSATINGGGTNGYVKGLVDYVQVSGFLNLDGFNGGWWLKLESGDACSYSIPTNYLNGVAGFRPITKRLLHVWFTHNQIGNSDGSHSCGGEGVYAISTGAYGRDPVPCLGNVIYQPLWGGFFHIDSNKIYNCGRSAIQLSGADTGFSTINGNLIRHAGRELNSSQGAAIRTGYGTSNNTEIAFNDIKYTYIYNLDIETGANVHNNIMDSAGWWDATHKNPQQIPSVICYALLPNSILKLQYNTAGANSAQPFTNFAIYGGNNYAALGNIVCGNNGNVQVLSLPFNYTTVCTGQDTACITRDTSYYVDADTTFHFDSTFRDSVGKVFVSTKPVTSVFKSRHWHIRYIGDSVDVHYRVLVRSAYDSAGICTLCKLLDTTYKKCPFPKTTYGSFLTPTDSTTTLASRIHLNKQYNCPAMRDNWVFGTAYQVQQYKDSGELIYQMVNSGVVADSPYFPTNQIQFAKTLDSGWSISPPYIAGIFNEPSNTWKGTGAGYDSCLTTAIPIAHAKNMKICNGGFTQDLCYPMKQYYVNRGYADSIIWLEGIFGTLDLTSSRAQQKLAFYNTVLPFMRNSALDYADIHAYTPTTNDSTIQTLNNFWTVATGFVMNQTLKSVIFSEVGFRNSNQALANASLTQIKQTQPAWIIGYPNNGTLAVANQTAWSNFVINNP